MQAHKTFQIVERARVAGRPVPEEVVDIDIEAPEQNGAGRFGDKAELGASEHGFRLDADARAERHPSASNVLRGFPLSSYERLSSEWSTRTPNRNRVSGFPLKW